MGKHYDVIPFADNTQFSSPLPPLEWGSCSRGGGAGRASLHPPHSFMSAESTLLEDTLKLGGEIQVQWTSVQWRHNSSQSLSTGSRLYTYTSVLHEWILYTHQLVYHQQRCKGFLFKENYTESGNSVWIWSMLESIFNFSGMQAHIYY